MPRSLGLKFETEDGGEKEEEKKEVRRRRRDFDGSENRREKKDETLLLPSLPVSQNAGALLTTGYLGSVKMTPILAARAVQAAS